MRGRPHRRKVTFEWNAEDVAKAIASALVPGGSHVKFIDLPLSNCALSSFDRVMMGDRMVGLSMFTGYSCNERAMLSPGIVDPDVTEGDVLALVWGEPDGGTAKSTMERHVQTEIRVKVSKIPCSRDARESYADSWRTRQS